MTSETMDDVRVWDDEQKTNICVYIYINNMIYYVCIEYLTNKIGM